MRSSPVRLFGGLCFFLALFVIPAFPQSATTGNITGRAQDSSGALIPGVEVTITSPAMIGGARSAVTDETGSYRFTLLPAGTYRVSFALSGFKTLNIDGVAVTPQQTMTINAAMEVATTSEEVTVTSQAPAIDLEAATVGVNWDIHKLDDLPHSRSLRSLNTMVPGVYYDQTWDVGGSQFGTTSAVQGLTFGRNAGGSLSGQNSDGNNVMAIDGLVWCQGYADYGSFAEVNFTTASKGADQGNAGLTMELIVKSGGNQFHGNFTQSYERGAWHPFGQSTNIDSTLTARGFAAGSNKFVFNRQTYGDIGGPILHDKLWFYFAYLDGQLNQFVPGYIDFANGQPGVFTSRLQNPTAKLTYQLNSKMKLETSWPMDLKTQPYRQANSRIPLQATENQHSWATYGPNLKWTDIINAKTTATASINRGGYWWPDIPWSGDKNSIVGNLPVTSTAIPTTGNANDVRRNDLTSNATLGPFRDVYRRPIRWTWSGDVARFQTIGGKNNEIKAGYTQWWTKNYVTTFGYPNQQLYRYVSLPSEDYLSTSNTVTPTAMLSVFQHPDSVQIFNYPNTTVSAFGYKAFYINDKINMTRRLTVTAGLRMDYYNSWLPAQGTKGLGPKGLVPDGTNSPLNGVSGTQAPDFTTAIAYPDIPSSAFPSYTRFVPRLSAAYDLMGDGRIALKVSYGRYTAYTSGPSDDLNDSGVVGPNSSTSTCTYNGWKGDIPFRPAPGNYLNVSCSGGLQTLPGQVGPNSSVFSVSDPKTWPIRFGSGLASDYLDEYTASADVGLSRDYAIRFGIVRKFDRPQEKFLDQAQPPSAYTDKRCYNYNAAANSITPASNDALPSGDLNSGVACAWSVPRTYSGQGQVNQLIVPTRSGEGSGQFTGLEFAFNKQYSNGWSFLASYDVAMHHTNPMDPIDPNETYYHGDNRQLQTSTTTSGSISSTYTYYGRAWDHGIKINGQKSLPWGFVWSSALASQSGQWFHRGIQIKNALGSTVVLDLASNVARYPWGNVWDQRFTKVFKFGDRQSVEAFYELFNTLNTNAVSSQGVTIGSSTFLAKDGSLYKPTAVISPRISQFSVRYKF